MAGLFLMSRLLFQYISLCSTQRPAYAIHAFLTTTISATHSKFDIGRFTHPVLSQNELAQGSRMGIDTWADTDCAGKHVYVEEFVVDKYVTAGGFRAVVHMHVSAYRGVSTYQKQAMTSDLPSPLWLK